MPRKSRNLNSKGFFHVMVQGNNKNYIFNKNNQKIKYLELMRKYKMEYEIKIIAYCIMDNHAHLLLYSNDINQISKYMQCLNGTYGIYYNKTNESIGFVYRNRFKSQYIYNEDYLKRCIKYIHMNPVKAGIVSNEALYLYSSFKEYLNKNINSIIDHELIKKIFQTENYISAFLKINDDDIEIMDIDIDNFKIAVDNYLKKQNISIEYIKDDYNRIKSICEYLKKNRSVNISIVP